MKISTSSKFLFFLFTASIATFFSAYAQVVISPPVNGRNISNDLSSVAGAPASAYTTLNDIVISETTPGDFAAGTNLTVFFDAPAGWRFNNAAGNATGVAVGSGANISNVSISAKATNRITVRYTITGLTNGANSITISNIQVQSTSAVVLDERFIFRQGGNGIINGLEDGQEVVPLSKVAGAFKFLQVLLPGQFNAPGTATGKSGATTVTPVAGANIPVIVNAVDFGYNVATTEMGDVISLTQNNPYGTVPAPQALNAGTTSFNVVMKSYSPTTPTTYYTVTATDDNDGGITPNTSSNIRVLAAPFEKLLTLFPGETYDPGSLTGKTATQPTAPVAGVNYPVTVYSVDAFWNRITSTDNVSISANATNFTAPSAANLGGGARTFNLLFKVAGETPTVVANDNTNNTITSYSQLLPAVQLGAFAKYQVLLPGETAAPGTVSGKTVSSSPLTAGVAFDVIVNAVDANWNILPTNTDEITMANVNGTYDPNSVFPGAKELENGTATFNITLKTAAINQQLRATAIAGTANSATFTVSPGAFSKLLTILPGETYLPGTLAGKSGSINPVVANANLTVTVRAVDTFSNTVPVTDNIQLSTTNVNGTFTSNNLPLVNGSRNFTARLPTAGNTSTITVQNAPDSKMDTTEPIEVTTGAFTKLVLILPGENDVQGIAAGKTGSPDAQVAGLPFVVKVKASDAYGNTVKSIDHTVTFTATNDIYAGLPTNMPLVDGELITTATYKIGNATNNRRLTVANVTDNTKTASVSPQFTVNVGDYAGLLAILPGETYAPGSEFGKLNSPSDQMPNAPFNLTVRAVDVAWNTVTAINDVVNIASSDAEATLPANAALVSGVKTNFSVTLKNNGDFTATSVTQPTKLPNTTEVVSVAPGTFVKLQLLLPGEIAAPGTTSGKTGSPLPITAGTAFDVIVNAVDARWNIVNVSDVVAINNLNATYNAFSTLPPNTALSAGTATLSVTQDRAATNHQLRATNITTPAITGSSSPVFTVAPGLYTRLLITLPGETYVPGTASGKTGSIDPVAVNANLTVNVRAVDALSNTVTSVSDVVNLTTTDVNGVFLTNNLALSAGTRNFTARLTTVGTTTTIKVADVPETKSYITGPITVNAGAFSKFVVILPGESDVQGTVAGKSGTPNAQAAGVPFNVTIKATDAYGNTITSINDAVSFTATNDPYAIFPTLPVDMTLTNGVLSTTVQYRIGNATNNRRLNVSKVGDNTKNGTSSLFTVNVGAYDRLLIVLPGEIYTAGAPNGKLNLPNGQTANVPFNVTVRAVDAAWNMITSVNDEVKLTSNVTATLPANPVLVNGLRTNVSLALSETGKLTVENITTPAINSYTTEDITITIGAFVKLQLLLPGETAAPGTAIGKTGSPTPRIAGVQFNVTVNAVDANWNIIPSVTDVVSISNVNSVFDDYSVLEASKALSSGTATFTVTQNRAATNHQLRATDVGTPSITVSTSPTFTVSPSTYARLLIVLPSETYLPGTIEGKNVVANAVAANANLTVTVRAVDAFSNTVTTVTDVVKLTTTDLNGIFTSNNLALLAGTRNFVARLATAGTATITVKDVPETKTYTTNSITVTAGAFTKLVLILPGEFNVEGIVAGKGGVPTARVAGVPFTVVVKASDAFGNTVVTANDVITFSATNDIYAVLPANTPLVNGVLTTSATYRIASAANDRRLTAMNFTDGTKTASQSPTFTVNTGAYAKLLIVLPGETYAPGAPTGKTNTPANQAVSVAFNITVRAVDAAWNLINTVSDQINISSNVGATLPPNGTLVNGVKSNFSVSLPSTGTLTATNVTDVGITSYTTGNILVFGATLANHFFRSGVLLGNWNNSSTWESSADGSNGWQPATISPTNASSNVVVRNGNTVSVTAPLSIDNLLIENGAQVNINGGTLTIANDGGAADDVVVAGILRSNNRSITTTGALKFAATGKYQHNFTTSSGTIPTAAWTAGSVCEIVGYTNFAGEVAGTNQTFSDFVWNTPNQNGVASPYLVSGFNARNFTVSSTGTGTLNFADAGGSFSITGDYNQTAGNVVANKTSGTQNLTFGGNFAVNGGSFSLGNGIVNLTYNGSSAQSLVNSGPEIEFQNVTFTNGGAKTLTSGNFSLRNTAVLTMGSGTSLDANGKLILRSNASSTASIATIPASSNISGNVKVERFISGGSKDKFRTFRMFSSPVYTNGDPGNKAYSFADFIDYMLIGGKGGGGSGFDATPGNAGAAFIYNAGFKEIENINTSLTVGKGAYIFFKGDRSNEVAKYTAPFVDPESVTMVFNGLLNQQDVNVTLIPNGNLVGNPYASSINWNSAGITKSNLKNNFIRIWDPAERRYATYDGLVGANGGSNIISSGQGFFVEAAAAGSASLAFGESAKVNTQPSTLLLAAPSDNQLTLNNMVMANNSNSQILNLPHTELRLTLLMNGSPFKDETVVVFKEGKSASFNAADDAIYFSGGADQNVFLASRSSDNRDLVINYMPEISTSSEVKLNLVGVNAKGFAGNANGNYQLKVTHNGLPSGYVVKLIDNFKGTTSLVQNGDVYDFSIENAVPNSFGGNRFSVSFDAPVTLPVALSSFTAAKTNEGVIVKWKSETEINHNRFELERAGEDQLYKKLYTASEKGSGSSYAYLDKTPLLGNNYYRLVQVNSDEKSTVTSPIVINYKSGVDNSSINIYPNPVKEQFTLQFSGALKGVQYTVKITNVTGQILLNQSINGTALLAGDSLNIANYAAGLYVVEVFETGNQKVAQTKLIKE